MTLYVKGDRVWALDQSEHGCQPLTVEESWGHKVMTKTKEGKIKEFDESDIGFLPVEHEPITEDKRALSLSHYVLAERMMQYEAYLILRDIREENNHDNLIHLLSDGFKGYHQMTNDELVSEWGDSEEGWYGAYDDESLPWAVYEDDPISILEQDENGEVEYAARKGKPT
jgi:hypothetical protein